MDFVSAENEKSTTTTNAVSAVTTAAMDSCGETNDVTTTTATTTPTNSTKTKRPPSSSPPVVSSSAAAVAKSTATATSSNSKKKKANAGSGNSSPKQRPPDVANTAPTLSPLTIAPPVVVTELQNATDNATSIERIASSTSSTRDDNDNTDDTKKKAVTSTASTTTTTSYATGSTTATAENHDDIRSTHDYVGVVAVADNDDGANHSTDKTTTLASIATPTSSSSAAAAAAKGGRAKSTAKSLSAMMEGNNGSTVSSGGAPQKGVSKTYIQLVEEAIVTLKEYRTGSSLASIKKYIITNYPQIYDVSQNNYFNARLNMALKTGCQSKPIPRFQKVKVSYRMAPEYKTNMSNKKRQDKRKSTATNGTTTTKSKLKQSQIKRNGATTINGAANSDANGDEGCGTGGDDPTLSIEQQQQNDERRRQQQQRRKEKEEKEEAARVAKQLMMDRIRRRKFPMEDTKLHTEDAMFQIKPPAHVTTRPYLPYFWSTTIPLHHPNRWGGKTTSSILNSSKVDAIAIDGHDTRGIVPDLLHIYHFFMGDIHFFSQQQQSSDFGTTTTAATAGSATNGGSSSSSSSSFNLKQMIYCSEQMINGTMKRTRCVPPFIVHLFVTCLQILLTQQPTSTVRTNDNSNDSHNEVTTKEEKQLRQDLHHYLYPALSAASWSDVTYLYMDAMQRFYTTDSSRNPNSIQPLLTDVNYLFGRTDEPTTVPLLTSPPPKQQQQQQKPPSSVDDIDDTEGNGGPEDNFQPHHPLPDGYVGYLGDERSTLHRAHTKLARHDPWLLTGEEILALLRALTEDVLATHSATGNDIEQRDDRMIELLKNKRAADMKFRKVRLAHEGPKKPSSSAASKGPKITDNGNGDSTNDTSKNEPGTAPTKSTENGKEHIDTKAKPFVPTATRKQYEVALKAQEKANDAYEKGMRKLVARTVPVGFDRHFNAVYCFAHDPEVLYLEEKKPPTDYTTFRTSSAVITIPHDMQFPRTSWHVIETTSICDKYAASLDIRGKREYDLYEVLMGPPGHTNQSLSRYLYDDIKTLADARSKVREKEILLERLKITQIKCDEERGRRSGRLAGQAEIELVQIQNDIEELETTMERQNKKTNTMEQSFTKPDYKELTGFNALVHLETCGSSSDTRRATRDKKSQVATTTSAPITKKLPLLYCSKVYPTGNIDGTGVVGILVSNMLHLEERCNSLAAWDRQDTTRSNWTNRLENTVSIWHSICPDLFGAPTTEPTTNKASSSSSSILGTPSSSRSQLKRDSMGSESGFSSSKRPRKTDSPSALSMGSSVPSAPTVPAIVSLLKQPLLDLEERVADITNVALATKDADLADDNMSTTEEDDDVDLLNRERMELKWKRLIHNLRSIPARRNSTIRKVVVDAITAARKAHLQQVVAALRDALLLYRPTAANGCKMAAIQVLISSGGYDPTDDDEPQEENENFDNNVDVIDNVESNDSPSTEETVLSVLSAEAAILRSSLGGSDDARREDWVAMVKSVKTLSRLATLTTSFMHDAMEKIAKVEAERDELVSALHIWSKAEERQSKQRDAVVSKAKSNTAREITRPSEVWADVRYTDEICMAKTDEYPWWPAKVCEAKDSLVAKSLQQLNRSIVAFVGEMGSLRVVKTNCIKPFTGKVIDDDNMDEYKKEIRTQLDDCIAMGRRIQRGLSKMK